MVVLTVAAFERAASKPKRVQSRGRREAAPALVAGGGAAVFASVGVLELESPPPQPKKIRGAIARMACSARLARYRRPERERGIERPDPLCQAVLPEGAMEAAGGSPS
jgi:hypothetical protein